MYLLKVKQVKGNIPSGDQMTTFLGECIMCDAILLFTGNLTFMTFL